MFQYLALDKLKVRSNTSSRVAFKIGGHGDGPRLSCMNCVGLDPAIMTALTRSKYCLGKGSLRNLLKKESKPGTSYEVLQCGPSSLNALTECSIVNNGMIWDELIIYAKVVWERVIKHIKISCFSATAMLQGFDKTWGARNVLCRRNNLHISWIWKRQYS